MKQKFIILSLLIFTCLYSHAYEVFEHSQGDESNLVEKRKVMKGRQAIINDRTANYSGIGISVDSNSLEIYDLNHKLFDGCFYPEEGASAIITPRSIKILGINDPTTNPTYDVSLEVEYRLVNGEKIYVIHFKNDNQNVDSTIMGRPTFFSDSFKCDLIGSETTHGNIPVLLEWLENWLKKSKFKIIK